MDMAERHEVWFKHKTGSLKTITGISDHEVLAPSTRIDHSNPQGPVYRTYWEEVKKVRLVPEASEVQLLPGEEKRPQQVKDRILDRRAAAADIAIQSNEIIRNDLRRYELSGDIEIVDWDHVVDDSDKADGNTAVAELSPIALLDFHDRGLTIPDHLQPSRVASAVAEANASDKKATKVK